MIEGGTHSGQIHAAPQHIGGTGVPHPVLTGSAQLVSRRGMLVRDRLGRLRKEPFPYRPQPRRGDATGIVPLQTAQQCCRRVPPRQRGRQPPLYQVPIRRRARHRRQSNAAQLASLADQA